MVNICAKCEKCFVEEELQLSHDVPRYMGGTDLDGRHYLCKDCHNSYELNIIKLSFMNLIKIFPEEWKVVCRNSARMVKNFTFKENKKEW